jgi:hypothetical protein
MGWREELEEALRDPEQPKRRAVFVQISIELEGHPHVLFSTRHGEGFDAYQTKLPDLVPLFGELLDIAAKKTRAHLLSALETAQAVESDLVGKLPA